MRVEHVGRHRPGRRGAPREVPEADDRQLRVGRDGLEVVRLGAARREVRRDVVVHLDQPAEPGRTEVLPRRPQLECPEAAGALEAELVKVELPRVVVGPGVRSVPGVVGAPVSLVARRSCRPALAAAVVLGRPVERLAQVGSVADEQRADVVRLEEPLVGIDGQRVGQREAGDAGRITGGEQRGPAVRGVDVEPEPLGTGERGQLGNEVDGARVRRSRDGADGDRPKPVSAICRDRIAHRRRVEAEPLVGRQHDERLGREAQLVERPRDREVRLVAGVDAHAVERGAAGRPVEAHEPPQVDVADERHRDEVGHDAARGEQPEAALAVAREVAQPSDDLLLDERTDRSRVPDVDALVRPLGEHLADDRGDQRRGREVAERARVVAVERVGRDPGAELGEDVGKADRVGRGRRGREAGAEVDAAQLRVARGQAHRADHRLVVEPVERGVPGCLAGLLERAAGAGRVADADELGLGVPGEGGEWVEVVEGVVHRREW